MKTVQPVSSSRKPDTNILSVYKIYLIDYLQFQDQRSTILQKWPQKLWKLRRKKKQLRETFQLPHILEYSISCNAIQREKWRFIVARRSRQSRARNNNWVGLVVFGYLLWGSRYFSTAWWLLNHCLSAGWLSSWLAGWRDEGRRERELGNAGSYRGRCSPLNFSAQ